MRHYVRCVKMILNIIAHVAQIIIHPDHFKPGRDPREGFSAFAFADVHRLEDLKAGMKIPGIVTNVTNFGCFVDVGVHQDGMHGSCPGPGQDSRS